MGGHPLRKTPMNALHPSRLGALALAAALAGCASAPTFHYTAPSQPEAASGSIRWSCRIPSSGGLSPRHVPAECRGS